MLPIVAIALMQVPAAWARPGDFVRPPHARPVIAPDPSVTFPCPMRGKSVHWEATHTFNPAAVVKGGQVWLLYRAEDDIGSGIGGYTSRLGLASSRDGIHFTRRSTPVLYPNIDAQERYEWQGGCEDPRCVATEDGRFELFYTQYARRNGHASTDLGMAESRDLIHWHKLGPVRGYGAGGSVVIPPKSASLLTRVVHGRLVAARLGGRYWLYYGVGTIRLLNSPDLRHWSVVPGFELEPRPGRFDSELAECGPPALWTEHGIVLLYNGMNKAAPNGDPSLPTGVYADGQAIFDPADPTKLLSRPTAPFFQPELPWEKTGQYSAGTTFIEGLVLFRGKWLLYYGCADTYVGVAMADARRLGI